MTDPSQKGPCTGEAAAPQGQKGPRTGEAEAPREARLAAALRSNLAKRKARAHAVRQPANPPHEGAADDGASASPRTDG